MGHIAMAFDFMKKRYTLFVAPTVTGVILLCIFAAFKVWPLGEHSISWGDMDQQVVPLLLQFRDILINQDSLFFSMKTAGGMNFWSVFLYFLVSPFSFLVVFVPKDMMWSFANLLVMGKMMTAAFSAALFFEKKLPTLGGVRSIALSVNYAFCGFGLMFYQNLTWLDMMYLFPLLCLALCHMADTGGIAPYTACLVAVVFVNFYLSYMIVIFILLSSWIYMQIFRKKPWEVFAVRLGLGSGVAMLLSAPSWYPALLSYLSSGRGETVWKSLASGDFFANLYTNLPLLFCTVGIISALLFVRGIFKSPKGILAFILLILLLIPAVIEPINKMWHTGNYQAFPLRYGYMTAFIGLVFVGILLKDNDEPSSLEPPLPTFGGIAVLSLWCGSILILGRWLLTQERDKLDAYATSLWGNKEAFLSQLPFVILLFGLWAVLFWLHKKQLLKSSAITCFVCVAVVAQSIFFTTIYMMTPIRTHEYPTALLDLEGRISDEDIYRVKATEKRFDINLIGAAGYNTFAHYTSLTPQDTMFTQKKMGYSSYWMELSSNGGTVLSDALLGIAYTIYHSSTTKPEQDIVYQNEHFFLVRGEGALPLATIIQGHSMSEIAELPSLDREENQRFLAQSFLGDDDMIITHTAQRNSTVNIQQIQGGRKHVTPIAQYGEQSILEYNIYVDSPQALYADCFGTLSNNLGESYFGAMDVWVNGERLCENYPSQGQNGLLFLGEFESERVKVEFVLKKAVEVSSFGVFGIETKELLQALQEVPTAEIAQDTPHSFAISAEGSQGDILMISIPHDDGFAATNNRQPVEIYTAFDGFMAIPLTVGSNEITLSYTPPGMWLSLGIAGVGILSALGLWWWQRQKNVIFAPMLLQKIAPIAIGLMVLSIFFVVYMLPVVIWVTIRR